MHLIKKNAQGYGYTYTDLAEITKTLAENDLDYYQFIEPVDGVDYIMTVIIDRKEGKASEPIRGCRVINATLSGKSNPAQEYGAGLTYCRRYSLLMAFGLATTDTDAAEYDRPTAADEKTLLQYEAVCQRRNIDPQTYYKTTLKKDGSYKNMTGAEFGMIMRKMNGGK